MRSLLWRVTLSHLLVSLGALLLLALLSPYFFRTYYARSEVRRVNAAVTGLSRAAAGLLKAGSPSPTLDTMIRNSATVLGGEVLLVRTSDGRVISTSGRHAASLEKRLEVWRPVAPKVQLIVRLPLTGLNEMMRAQRVATLFACALATLLALALALALSRGVTSPLIAMSQAAQRLAAEDFTVRVPQRGPQEIASLASSLNRMAEDLEVAFNDMRRLAQLRRDFVANASHELRAPLTNIRGFLDAVLDGTASPDEQTRCLQTASAEARRMTRIVEELLQLSRLQAGVLQFDLAPQDLREIVESVAASFDARLNERDVAISIHAADIPIIEVDGDKLAQVLVNLLDNALRYSPPGGTISVSVQPAANPKSAGVTTCVTGPADSVHATAATTRVTGPAGLPQKSAGVTTCVTGPADGVRVTVADQGPGIPDGDLTEIFERFHKVDPARPRTEPGAGLGLAIAKEIIQQHGGEVFAANRDGGGAEIGFWLPAGDPGPAL